MGKFKKCTLIKVEYKCQSSMGNPSYWVLFQDEEDNFHRAYTSSNSSAGYTIENYADHVECDIYLDYHYTRKGSCIITRIQHITPEEAKGKE